MYRIELSDVDRNLRADLGDDLDGVEAYRAEYPGATVGNQCYHIVFCPKAGRGGIVFVGSGSSGTTFWTDADDPFDVLVRYFADGMTP